MIDPRDPDYNFTPACSRRPRFGADLADCSAAPKLTVITPYFNTGPIFEETARSIFNQSFQQWEWLIINDASSEPQSLSVLEKYRARDPRVRVIDHQVNLGLSGARNTGFMEARTPLVMQIDSDDLLEPTTLEKMAWYLETHPEAGFVHGYSVGFGAETYLWKHGFHRGAEFLNENFVTATAMIRRSVHQRTGGFCVALRGGLEDWDFWLKCASHGIWGGDIPEFLDWYRRRPSHGDRWSSLADERVRAQRKRDLLNRYPSLSPATFPRGANGVAHPNTLLTDAELLNSNRLAKKGRHMLAIVPWLRVGGADRFNLDLVQQLTSRGWVVSIVTTLPGNLTWMPDFGRLTSDIFALHDFLPPNSYSLFLRYLIDSRQPDIVMISNSEYGYQLLPYLRSVCPKPVYVDYNHMEEESWKGGGYPAFGVSCQKQLDLNIVASQHLKNWMVGRGADAQRIEVATINVDPRRWVPDAGVRRQTRRELGIGEHTPIVLYAGRLCPQKRPRVFAETMRRLIERKGDFAALVAGEGEDRVWLEGFVAEQGLGERVRLLGEQTIEQMHKLILASDIFFLPSEWEGIALSIYEAMAAGLAVVGADVGGQRELLTPDCGVLVPRTDVETETREYVAALERYLADEPLRVKTGERARRRIVEHFALDRMGERMVALFERAGELQKTSPRERVPVEAGIAAAQGALEHVLRELEWARRTAPAIEACRGSGNSQVEHLNAELAMLRKQYDELRNWCEEQDRAICWFRGQVQSHSERADAATREAERLHQELARLREELDLWQRQIAYRAMRKLSIMRRMPGDG